MDRFRNVFTVLLLAASCHNVHGSPYDHVDADKGNVNTSSEVNSYQPPAHINKQDLIEDEVLHEQNPELLEITHRIDDLERDLVPTDLLGWTVFQRRMDGTVSFYRQWNSYLNGFGNPDAEFWLGLRKISNLMSRGNYELRIDMQDFDGQWRYAYYKNFKVGSEYDNFPITTSGYKGTAGDCLTLTNVKFSTQDHDHDSWSGNCAQTYKGAWWYTACHCGNLNGQYLGGSHTSFADGVDWNNFRGYYYSLKFTEMKMRLRPN